MFNTKILQAQMRIVIRILKNPLMMVNHNMREYTLTILEDISLRIEELEADLRALEIRDREEDA